MKNKTRKQITDFNNEVLKILEFYGVEKTKNEFDKDVYFIDSEKIGRLNIRLDHDISKIYTIFTRFEDTDKASKYFDCGFSGKLNYHGYFNAEGLCFIDDLLNNYNLINGIDKHKEYEEMW